MRGWQTCRVNEVAHVLFPRILRVLALLSVVLSLMPALQ